MKNLELNRLSEKILKTFNISKSNNEKENKSNNGEESDIKKTYVIKDIEITKEVKIIENSNDNIQIHIKYEYSIL